MTSYKITAQTEGDSAEVLIYDVISSDGWSGITARGLIRDVQQFKGKRLNVRINSIGGDVVEGNAIYNFLKGRGNVHTYVDGIAASMGSILMLAGETVTIAKNAMVMIHNLSADPGSRTPDELRKAAAVADKFNDGLVATYVEETGQDEKQVRKWMDEEKWFTASEAKEFGFVDEISGAIALAAIDQTSLSRFRRVPEALGGKPAAQQNNTKERPSYMEKLLAALVAAGLLPTAKLEDAEAADIFKAEWKKQTDARAEDAGKIKALEGKVEAARKSQAEAYVGAAVKAGKIKDDAALKGRWVTAYLADEAGTQAMLDGMEAKAPSKGAPPVPETGNEGDKSTEDTLRAELQNEQDPVKRGELARKLRDARGHKNLFA